MSNLFAGIVGYLFLFIIFVGIPYCAVVLFFEVLGFILDKVIKWII